MADQALKWNEKNYLIFLDELKSYSDEKYRVFNEQLMPGTKNTLGIRVPVLRDIAKKIAKDDAAGFLAVPKGVHYEEILLEGLVIGYAKLELSDFLRRINQYAGKVNNWALCDVAVSTWKQIGKQLSLFWDTVLQMVKDENPWINRVGIIIMLDYYLTPKWIEKVFDTVEQIKCDAYYVRMAIACLLSTAAAKEREKTLKYLKSCQLDIEILKMTAQKMRDSRRVMDEDKRWITSFVNRKV